MVGMNFCYELHDFWERVDAEIYRQKRTKLDVAKCCNFDRKILIERRNPSTVFLIRICRELNVSADYLLFGNE